MNQDTTRRHFLLRATACAGSAAGLASLAGCATPLGGDGKPVLGTMGMAGLSRALALRQVSSRQLVEQALAAIAKADGEGARVFLQVHAAQARATAAAVDARRRAGQPLGPLAGIPVSIKDLFDEAGQTTRGGSRLLAGQPPAQHDALAVRRLRDAGMVIIGRTNTVEFAYTGLGINPHYGTPLGAFDRAARRIPGGSSSGAAISVTDGMAAGAIGTDTGGSTRIPAALNGLVGWKPTQRRIPRDGVLPLSTSFDSVGCIGRSVEDCALLDSLLAGEPIGVPNAPLLYGLRLAVPTTYFQDELSPAVANAFRTALARLAAAGATVVEMPMPVFAQTPQVNPRGMITAAEAYAFYKPFLDNGGAAQVDPRVLARLSTGANVSAADLDAQRAVRHAFIASVNAAAAGFDALLMPTTPDTAPTIAEVEQDEASYYRFNGRLLRNPAAVNLFDGCALSVPCQAPGTAPVGLMIAGLGGSDARVLAVGRTIAPVVAPRAG